MQSDPALDRLVVSLHVAGEGDSFIGNGFLVSPRHVLTAASVLAVADTEGAAVIRVRFAGFTDAMPHSATLKQRIPEARAALLELSGEARAPLDIVPPLDDRPLQAGNRWRCAFVAPGFPGLIHATGTTFGVEAGAEGATVLISPNPTLDGDFTGSPPPLWPAPVGAPIAIEDRVVGLIVPPTDPVQQSPPWTAVPSNKLLTTNAAALWRAALEARGVGGLGGLPAQNVAKQAVANDVVADEVAADAAADEPFDRFSERFTASARRALSHANGLRERQRQPAIHMEHLLMGLFEDPEGVPRRLFKNFEVDQKKLREIVKEGVGVELPADYRPLTPTAAQALSGHARSALDRARSGAGKERPLQASDLLHGALQVEGCSLIKPLREKGLTPEAVRAYQAPASARSGRAADSYVLADVGSDQPKGIDQLDISDEVEALASVVAARDTDPPIAIGLFGEWGSGKSFFMGKMVEEVKKLAAEGKSRPDTFCAEIVQIPFNAWHYVDVNLWASLLTEMFEYLSAHLADKKGETDAVKRARLLTRVASQKDVIAEAQKEKAAAETALQVATARIDRLEVEQKRVEKTLSTGLLREVMRDLVFRETPAGDVPGETPQQREQRQRTIQAEKDIRAQVETAVKTLGVSAGRATPELKAALLEAKGLAAYWKTLSAGKSPGVALALALGLALLLGAIVAALAFRGPILAWLTEAGSLLPRLVAAAAPLLAALAWVGSTLWPWVKKAREATALLRGARTRHEQTIEAETDRKKNALEGERTEIEKKAAEAHAQVQRATDELRSLEEDLDRLRADRRMSEFIRERSTSTDYTRYQGIMARAQHDFEQLSKLLKDVEHETERKDLPTIDRIVLYIDDLDRCPENKVFDVLQAVHLLLAYPLFVVVVGVDPRWLLHSLSARARALSEADDGDGQAAETKADTEWVATPMDYLEKIFQIPYTLRPMEKGGYEKLIDALAKSRTAPVAETKPEPPPPQPPVAPSPGAPSPPPAAGTATPQSGAAAPGAAGTTPAPPPGQGTGAPPPTEGQSQAQEAKTARRVERLQFSDPERAFMKLMYEFIPSPRATKRFVNVYRLIRTSADELFDDLVGDAEWGDHRAVLMLLAILTGYPEQATEMLEALLLRHHDETWWEFVDGFSDRGQRPAAPADGAATGSATADPDRGRRERSAEQWRELCEKLERAYGRGDIPHHKSCWYFERWARRVARYSFRSGRVLITQRQSDGGEAPATAPPNAGPSATTAAARSPLPN